MTNPRPRHLRAPTEDGAALIAPPLSAVPKIVSKNREIIKGIESELPTDSAGRSNAASTFVALSKFQLKFLADSISESGSRSENRWGCVEVADRPLGTETILSGHQPELFHPGVWFKTFALASLRTKFGGHAVNVVIDNDAVKMPSVQIPVWSGREWRLETMAFDAHDPSDFEIAWEERTIRDQSTFESFGKRVTAVLASWPKRSEFTGNPLIARLWPHALRIAKNGDNQQSRLGATLAAARHALERDIGLDTAECPLSEISSMSSFGLILAIFLIHLPVVHEAYNDALATYRLANRIRSVTHPVPALATDGDWWEAPCWIWSKGDPRRRRLFARRRGNEIDLTDRAHVQFSVPAGAEFSTSDAILSLEKDAGIKIRPRAIITTMYLRLYLSDLFIHGIGGAKYDELTDEIIRRFFGIEPPAYLTATATFRLPIDRPQVAVEDVREVTQRIRDGRYRPESFVGDPLLAHEPQIAQQLSSLAAEKRDYVRSHALRRGSEDVFVGLDRLNRAMHELLRPVEEHLRREHARLVEEARRGRVLGSREFSFVLFPEEYLVPRLLALAQVPA